MGAPYMRTLNVEGACKVTRRLRLRLSKQAETVRFRVSRSHEVVNGVAVGWADRAKAIHALKLRIVVEYSPDDRGADWPTDRPTEGCATLTEVRIFVRYVAHNDVWGPRASSSENSVQVRPFPSARGRWQSDPT